MIGETKIIADERTNSLLVYASRQDMATIKEIWSKTVDEVLSEPTLKRPPDAFMMTGGRKGLHSEHMGFILAEMQHVTRAYPGVEW